MQEAQRIDWTRTRLQPHERIALLAALTSEQEAQLLDHDYTWVHGVGVLWKAAGGALRRARFTHGTHFKTRRGEFYIDSTGSARQVAGLRVAPLPPSPRRFRALGNGDGSMTPTKLSLVPADATPVTTP